MIDIIVGLVILLVAAISASCFWGFVLNPWLDRRGD